jgi:succinate dehydrogenase / fumarate reductase cytochrome b subunit
MQWLTTYLQSSIGKKYIMGVTGLLLCGFLISHLAGNLLIICSPQAFNEYAHALITNPFITIAEIGLASLFVVHISAAVLLIIENKKARPQKYVLKKNTGRGSTFASSTMPYTGFIILVFLILHLLHFRFGPVYHMTYDGVKMRDLHRLILETFASPYYTAWYVFAQTALGVHVSHGFHSAFQSLGINHPKYTPIIKKVSCLYAIVIALGFNFIAVWCFIQGGL